MTFDQFSPRPFSDLRLSEKKVPFLIGLIILLLLGVGILIFLLTREQPVRPMSTAVQTVTPPVLAWSNFVSAEDHFSANFPLAPTRSTETHYFEEIQGDAEIVTYESAFEGALYIVYVINFSTPAMNEASPDFVLLSVLEGALQGMVQNCADGKIISQKNSVVDKHQAIRFVYSCEDDFFNGFVSYDTQSLYIPVIDYAATTLPSPERIIGFMGGFSFEDQIIKKPPF